MVSPLLRYKRACASNDSRHLRRYPLKPDCSKQKAIFPSLYWLPLPNILDPKGSGNNFASGSVNCFSSWLSIRSLVLSAEFCLLLRTIFWQLCLAHESHRSTGSQTLWDLGLLWSNSKKKWSTFILLVHRYLFPTLQGNMSKSSLSQSKFSKSLMSYFPGQFPLNLVLKSILLMVDCYKQF